VMVMTTMAADDRDGGNNRDSVMLHIILTSEPLITCQSSLRYAVCCCLLCCCHYCHCHLCHLRHHCHL
jgi:hypothetical protein